MTDVNAAFNQSLYLHHKKQDTAVGLRGDSTMTKSVGRYAFQDTMDKFEKAVHATERMMKLRVQLAEYTERAAKLEKKARKVRGRGKKKKVNEYYKEMSEYVLLAQEAVDEIQQIETEICRG